jgi:arylsulfatase
VTAQPNIVFLLSDQHRADVVGAAGHPVVQTPNLDALAATGTLFGWAYCQGPLCVPARVSLLTERYVRDHGASSNKLAPVPGLPTMVEAIRDAGYHTAAIGKMHLYPHPADMADGLPVMHGYGFVEADEIGGKLASSRVASAYPRHLAARGLQDQYRNFVRRRAPYARAPANWSLPPWTVDPSRLPAADYIDAWTGDRAARWIENRRGDQPFFLRVGFPGRTTRGTPRWSTSSDTGMRRYRSTPPAGRSYPRPGRSACSPSDSWRRAAEPGSPMSTRT